MYVLDEEDIKRQERWRPFVTACVVEHLRQVKLILNEHTHKANCTEGFTVWEQQSQTTHDVVYAALAVKIAKVSEEQGLNPFYTFFTFLPTLRKSIEMIGSIEYSGVYLSHLSYEFSGSDPARRYNDPWMFVSYALSNALADVCRDSAILRDWRNRYLGKAHFKTQEATAWAEATRGLARIYDPPAEKHKLFTRHLREPDLPEFELEPSWEWVTRPAPPPQSPYGGYEIW